jgi:hypothetical protein
MNLLIYNLVSRCFISTPTAPTVSLPFIINTTGVNLWDGAASVVDTTGGGFLGSAGLLDASQGQRSSIDDNRNWFANY